MKRLKFPEGFLWGVATSAHQFEGGNKWNDWWKFEQEGKVKNNERSEDACLQYTCYQKDINLLKKLNLNTYRLSVEWSRIEKEKGKIDYDEIKHYRKVLSSLRSKNIKVILTLFHFTVPQWFSEEGGWANEASIKYFSKFTKIIVKELGDYVSYWITLNEPMTPYATAAFLTGYWPPEEKSIRKFFQVLNNLSDAHKSAYRIIHEEKPDSKVGIASNNAPYVPVFIIDILFKPFINYVRNFFFLDRIANHQDFIGINYYFPLSKWFSFCSRSDMNWPIYPKGIYDVVTDSWRRYKKPIIITENGIADRQDVLRKKFIRDHLLYLNKAVKAGADVKGYLHWSLLDNFEWREGFYPRFGLVEINYKNNNRIIRDSAKYYAEICKKNYLELDETKELESITLR